jgi:hypothetical protein
MVKRNPTLVFPVRGVPGGWRDEWSGPDDVAIVRAQFGTWEDARRRRAAAWGPPTAASAPDATAAASTSAQNPRQDG